MYRLHLKLLEDQEQLKTTNTINMKRRRLGSVRTEHKVVRNFVKNCEITAKSQVLEKTGLQSKAFSEAHTKTCFIFIEK